MQTTSYAHVQSWSAQFNTVLHCIALFSIAAQARDLLCMYVLDEEELAPISCTCLLVLLKSLE